MWWTGRFCQEGFTKGKACLTNLIHFTVEWLTWCMTGAKWVWCPWTSVRHCFPYNPCREGAKVWDGWKVKWVENWLNARPRGWWWVQQSPREGSVSGSVLPQQEADKIICHAEGWAGNNIMKFKVKCKVLHLGKSTPMNSTGWGHLAGKQPRRKMRVLVDTKLNLSHLLVKKANGVLADSSGGRQPFPATQQKWGHLECYIWFWVFPYKRDRVALERDQSRVTKILKEWEHLFYKESTIKKTLSRSSPLTEIPWSLSDITDKTLVFFQSGKIITF